MHLYGEYISSTVYFQKSRLNCRLMKVLRLKNKDILLIMALQVLTALRGWLSYGEGATSIRLVIIKYTI